MVNYSNPELFYEHESVHWVIVNASAIVTGVSEDEPTITDADFVITEEDIELEKMTIDESICSLDNLTFGQCEASRIQFTMYTKQGVPSLEDAEIAVYLYFNGDSSTLFQVGVYVIEKDNLSVNRDTRDISGYDIIYYLRDYDITDWYNEIYASNSTVTVKNLRDGLFDWLAEDIDDFSITQETTTLDNDDFAIEKSIESDTITFAFFMQRLLEINGVFGHINRQGVFTYVKLDLYENNPVATIADELLIPPVKYQDWNTWGIGYVIVYDRNNNKLAKIGDSAYRHPSNYTVVDSFVFYNNLKRSGWEEEFETAVSNMREAITHRRYRSCEINCIGSLCLEVGDRIDVQWNEYDDDDNITVKKFKTFILERRFTGIQGFDDTYIAKGDKKQPKYQIGKNNDNWHTGDNQINSLEGVENIASDTSLNDFVEIIRNIGFRLLDEPTDVSVEFDENSGTVKLKWTDPANIVTSEPVSATWAGTVIVRKEGSAPLNRYDGTEIVDSTTRDEYSVNAYEDTTIESNKEYYYGIFPYDTNGCVRFTKVERVVTGEIVHEPDTWITKSWSGSYYPISGLYVWSDGDNIYYSEDERQYKLNKTTGIWELKTWHGYNPEYGHYIWTDGENIYYSNSTNQYTLDKATDTWEENNFPYFIDGRDVWTDGTDIFITETNYHRLFKFDKTNQQWNFIEYGSFMTDAYGADIWSDGVNLYYSSGITQHVLEGSPSRWGDKTWNGLTRYNGGNVWTDGTNIFFSRADSVSQQYKLNVATSTWEVKTWNNLTSFTGRYIWTDGTHIYYSDDYDQYELQL